MSEPVHIGVLRDVHAPDRHDYGGNALRLAVDEANAAGGAQGRRIELVERITHGHKFGTQAHIDATSALWRDLADDPRILGIIGPSTTPCVLDVHPEVEARGIPQVHWAGTDAACGDWHFQFQAGYLPDEGRALVYLLTRLGHRRVVCFCGEGSYGDAYMNPFTSAAGPQGIEILGRFALPHTAQDVSSAVEAASRLGADAVVGLGLLGVADKLVGSMRAIGWQSPCFGNCGFALFASGDPAMREMLDGWTATDMYDPGNRTATDMFDRYEAVHGIRPNSATSCFGYDLARLMIEGLRAAPEMTRAGLRMGLEALRGVSSATGGSGSYMAFSERDRQALKGPRLFVFNRITSDGLKMVAA
ncbi:MAG: ABC transporter substrate-binding protein [Novosphingobium sp.]|nr:ABC transporter substrate-binding protein [Novosphingobium sp.]